MAERYLKPAKSTGKFFFIDKRLHRVLRINRPANLVEAWSFEDDAKVTLLHSDFKQKAERAMRTQDAARILNVSKKTLERTYREGHIREPSQSHPFGNQKAYTRLVHWWGLWNILEAYEYMMTVHQGRPRKDGEIRPNQKLPTRAEVIARVDNQVVLFTKTDAEHYLPHYKPPTF